ncbi:hypothetical protein B0H66DRAFT_569315 [Apodospora peruviana]|uniref:Uncharacterized protein n=1 Tax=Apodospora peruviana TaxID=516989 RepID=A0AAE0HU73_9PEZI|nr:hypothetical protein B0H66DRAFT_569315 [Apodospora peruviana]
MLNHERNYRRLHHHHRYHHHDHHQRRRHSRPYAIPQPEIPPVAPRLLSHIHPIHLEESVDGGRGHYASVSVLDPVMRIERSGGNCAGNPTAKPVYRIILNLRMQLSINQKSSELQKHNRIFDSINVRYLYRSGERHDILPKGDQVTSDITFRGEDGDSTDIQAGIGGSIGGQPMPALTVHAAHASKLTYERKLRSWRKSLTYEKYPPPTTETKHGGITSLFNMATQQGPLLPKPESHFRVSSTHADKCSCRRPRRCRARYSRHGAYDRAAHWSGQTEAQLHLWTPEIYENINCPLTITREVDAEEIDHILNNGASSFGRHILRRYLHFDFDMEIRLREIGWGFWGLFKSSSEPAEIRARNDSGRPLAPDRSSFCVTCCTERISWPQFETRDLQTEAEEQIAKYGYVRRLQTTEEYQNYYNGPTAILGDATAYHYADEGRAGDSHGSTAVARGRPPLNVSASSASDGRRRVSFSPEGRLRVFGQRILPSSEVLTSRPSRVSFLPRAPSPPPSAVRHSHPPLSPRVASLRWSRSERSSERFGGEVEGLFRDDDGATEMGHDRHSEYGNYRRPAVVTTSESGSNNGGEELWGGGCG